MKIKTLIKTYFPIFVWPAVVLIIHQTSTVVGLYDKFRWLDTPFHFIGGMAIATSAFYIFEYLENKNEFKTIRIVKILLAVALTALAAVMWEQIEFASDTLFNTSFQHGVWDTMKDLTMGLLGATTISLFKNLFIKQ